MQIYSNFLTLKASTMLTLMPLPQALSTSTIAADLILHDLCVDAV